jgi:hypothetical protein
VFGFRKETQFLHESIDQIFKAAKVLEYIAVVS